MSIFNEFMVVPIDPNRPRRANAHPMDQDSYFNLKELNQRNTTTKDQVILRIFHHDIPMKKPNVQRRTCIYEELCESKEAAYGITRLAAFKKEFPLRHKRSDKGYSFEVVPVLNNDEEVFHGKEQQTTELDPKSKLFYLWERTY